MSDLRIGQRCRLVNVRAAPNPDWRGCEGDEVTILGLPGCEPLAPGQYEISPPQRLQRRIPNASYFTIRERLRPLTDPGADAFMERIKRLGREPVSDAPKIERVTK